MHVGNYLKDVIKRERYSMSQIAEKVNKSAAGVKKDLEKDKLSMAVLESYAEVLDINLYALLAQEWNDSHHQLESKITIPSDSIEAPQFTKKIQKYADEEVSVTISLKGKKKERILKILFEES